MKTVTLMKASDRIKSKYPELEILSRAFGEFRGGLIFTNCKYNNYEKIRGRSDFEEIKSILTLLVTDLEHIISEQVEFSEWLEQNQR